jgi:hypothetical protein
VTLLRSVPITITLTLEIQRSTTDHVQAVAADCPRGLQIPQRNCIHYWPSCNPLQNCTSNVVVPTKENWYHKETFSVLFCLQRPFSRPFQRSEIPNSFPRRKASHPPRRKDCTSRPSSRNCLPTIVQKGESRSHRSHSRRRNCQNCLFGTSLVRHCGSCASGWGMAGITGEM